MSETQQEEKLSDITTYELFTLAIQSHDNLSVITALKRILSRQKLCQKNHQLGTEEVDKLKKLETYVMEVHKNWKKDEETYKKISGTMNNALIVEFVILFAIVAYFAVYGYLGLQISFLAEQLFSGWAVFVMCIIFIIYEALYNPLEEKKIEECQSTSSSHLQEKMEKGQEKMKINSLEITNRQLELVNTLHYKMLPLRRRTIVFRNKEIITCFLVFFLLFLYFVFRTMYSLILIKNAAPDQKWTRNFEQLNIFFFSLYLFVLLTSLVYTSCVFIDFNKIQIWTKSDDSNFH